MPTLTEPLVCEDECNHVDCNNTKEFVKTATCFECVEPIHPGEPYYNDDGVLHHRGCLITQVEREIKLREIQLEELKEE